MKKEQINIKTDAKIQLIKLIDGLQKLGVNNVTMEFSGGGDDGSIDTPEAQPSSPEAVKLLETHEQVLHSLVQDSGYDWWNNDGGYGTLTLDVTKRKLDIDMNINREESDKYPLQAKL